MVAAVNGSNNMLKNHESQWSNLTGVVETRSRESMAFDFLVIENERDCRDPL